VQYHRAVRLLAIVPALALAACSRSGDVAPARERPALPAFEASLACSGASGAGFTTLQVGFAGGDATAAKPGFDVRAQYVAGVLAPDPECLAATRADAVGCGAQWWGTWQSEADPPGAFVRGFVADTAASGLVPLITYYVILPASGAVGMAFGSGASGQTTPESDGGYLWACAAALALAGGQPLCVP